MSARRFKGYPAYRDSGVEWLGEIPSHWDHARMWRICTAASGGTPAREERGYWDGDVPWVSPKDMKRRIIDSSEDTITERAIAETGIKLIPPPSILVVVRGMILAHSFPVAITSAPVTINQDMKALRFRAGIRPAFTAWLLEGIGKAVLATVVEEAAHGTRVIRMDQWRSLTLPIPPHEEQDAIIAFLDRETARIDALVTKKERLIKLLQEKRVALITRAVTKGLAPNVPMKDSGVEWLGQIPSHWDIKPFTKYVVEKADYRGKTPSKVASGIFLVTARNVRMGRIDYECSQEFVADDEFDEIMRRGLPRIGDVLFTTEAPLGNVALVDREDIALAQRIIRFRMNAQHFDAHFTLSAMMSNYFQSQLLKLSTGSTAEGLKASKLSMLWLVAPPMVEQVAIAAYIERQTRRIETLVVRLGEAIHRLNGLRTALISAAVTGKIDVREALAADASDEGPDT